MYKKGLRKIAALVLAGCMTISLVGCGSKTDEAQETSNNSKAGAGSNSSGQSQDGAYEEEVTINMGRETAPNPKLPEGDSYEDNAYTRMVKECLNIKIVDEFEANGEDYTRQVSLALAAGEIPDVLKVGSLDELKELYENDLIADLTDVYDEYASDYLKEIYDSFEGRALGKVTFDGQLMALPGTRVDGGPSQVWIRSDWMEKLGITIDEDNNRTITIEELEMVAKEFVDKNPGNAANTVGMAFAPWLTGGEADGAHTINSVAYSLGAYPRAWMEIDGKLEYGSTSEEMKNALGKLAQWYKDGLADPQLGTRTWDDITALLSNGQTGITFGSWHCPDWLLNNVRTMDSEAMFESYAIENAEGKVNCKHDDAANGYIVVSKNYENPEAIFKIANLIYDTMVNSKDLLEQFPEVDSYINTAVDGSVRPFNMEINSYTSLLDDYKEIESAVNKEITLDEVKTIESTSIVTSINKYLENPAEVDVASWAKYHSRMKGVELIQTFTEKDMFNWVTPIYPQTTPTMETNQANLTKLEEETFIKIATGAISLEEGFSNFVVEWNKLGGEKIKEEIQSQLE